MSGHEHGICKQCGATVFPEQIENGLARMVGGRLLCMPCLEEYEQTHDASSKTGSGYQFAPIAFRDEEDSGEPRAAGSSAGSAVGVPAPRADLHLTRPLDPSSPTATRCRTFHCKLNDAAIEFMNNAINSWIDAHQDIRIKFATSTLGVFEGKNKEPNLILTLFY